jgi:hypothetical protein
MKTGYKTPACLDHLYAFQRVATDTDLGIDLI